MDSHQIKPATMISPWL